MSTIKSTRVSKATGKIIKPARKSQWRKAFLDGNKSQSQIVKAVRELIDTSDSSSTLSEDLSTPCRSNWSQSVRIERLNGLRNRKLARRAMAIFTPIKTQGRPDPSVPDPCLGNGDGSRLYEQCLNRFDRYLKQPNRSKTLRHIRATDRGKIPSLLHAQASYIYPSQVSLGAGLGPKTIKSWLRDIGLRTTRKIPEITIPIVKGFLKLFQTNLQLFRAKQRDASSKAFNFKSTPHVSKPSYKRPRPSQFDFDLERQPCKRLCIHDRESDYIHQEHPSLTPFTTLLAETPKIITERSLSPSSSRTSYNAEDDDTLSGCSTNTSCTALSYDEELPLPTLADLDEGKNTSEDYCYQEPPLCESISWEKEWAVQVRAADPGFVPSDYDRSFTLSECGPEVDDIENKEPSTGYLALSDAQAQSILKDLKACRLNSEFEWYASSRPIDMPADVVNLPRQVSDSLTTVHQFAKSASNEANHTPISNHKFTISQQPPTTSPPVDISQSGNSSLNQQSILGKRKANETTPHPLNIIRKNLDLIPEEHHELVDQMISECKGSDLNDDACLRSTDNFTSLTEPLTKDIYGFKFIGEIFYFRELSAQECRTWYRILWKEATKEPLAFRDTLITMFMNGLHPQDCFPRGSAWIKHFFEEHEPRLNNKRLDDRHAWYDLRCNMKKPSALELPSEEGEKFVRKFMDEASLDILQKVMEDWLDVDSEDLLAQRTRIFRGAMEEAYLCGPESNKHLQELIKWLDGCQMGHEDTYGNPNQARRREVFEGALEKLLWYRYPRSSKWDANAELLFESYNERHDDDDEWLVDNKIPGRETK